MVVKKGSNILLFTRNISQHENRYLLRVKGWEKVFQSKGPKKQAAVAILKYNKTDFTLK